MSRSPLAQDDERQRIRGTRAEWQPGRGIQLLVFIEGAALGKRHGVAG